MSTETKTVAQYKTHEGATVTIAEQSGYIDIHIPTEHFVSCNGCDETHTEDWGFDVWHDEFGDGPQPNFDSTGQHALPVARTWAQTHAETCRALPNQ
ncbi:MULTISPECIES: hypothetical protein [Streptomyces]|uniref:hypothetical protein n=1 Tax=Streptomyces TaxID=1883 RepID=UPI0020614375|nr:MULTISPECIES: hypothetical protein [Streptomyces]UPT41789.1 hypothetical protein MWG59_10315 [Streptomyces sp. WAC00303]WIY76022.1 hypothetical protein QPM16_10175 [Streptomyces anulatus]